ncbi:hypothetical protein GT755_12195 [Herbidospora sp. NEAU-GS84]|uniref:Uncharacterized protein n=1 Tax=Herbidospora solisilvae TaxID=2696284 RepID=A0A7C9J259_9ACTN|nr:hypothetical protein [Herbidospora solisilvae]NAS22442.1 hypothetical protein [Herbidospora solisilvae]
MSANEMRRHIEGCPDCRADQALRSDRIELGKAAKLRDKALMRFWLLAIRARLADLHVPAPARDLAKAA